MCSPLLGYTKLKLNGRTALNQIWSSNYPSAGHGGVIFSKKIAQTRTGTAPERPGKNYRTILFSNLVAFRNK